MNPAALLPSLEKRVQKPELRSLHTEQGRIRKTSKGGWGRGCHRDRKAGEGGKWESGKHQGAAAEFLEPVGRLLEFTAGLTGEKQVWFHRERAHTDHLNGRDGVRFGVLGRA